MVHRICSDACFTKFRATKGLKTNCCDNCGLYIYNKGLPLEYLFHEGQQKRFCNSACLNSYKKVCGASCLGWGVSVGTQLLCSVWHRALYAIAGDLNLLGLLLLTKHLRDCCGETLKQANRIYLFCVGPILDPSTGQALSKLDCAVTLVHSVSVGWLLLDVSPKLGWIYSSVA